MGRASPTRRLVSGFLMGAVVVVGVALRLPGLFESLWYDEVYRTFVVMQPGSIGHLLWHDVHNPLYNALMYGWIRVFGDSEVSIRTPSMLAGAALAWVVWRWAGARFGAWVGRWAGAWLVVSPVAVWYSTEAKNTIFTALAGALVLVAHDGLGRTGAAPLIAASERRGVAWCVLACVGAVLTDFQTLLVIIPVWASTAWDAWRGRREHAGAGVRLAWVMGLTTLLLMPLIVFKATHAAELAREYLILFNVRVAARFALLWLPWGITPEPGWWALEAALSGLILLPLTWLGARVLRRSSSGRALLWVGAAGPAFYLAASALLIAVGQRSRIFQDRNLIVLLPWFPVLLGAGIGAIDRPAWRRAAGVLALGGALVMSGLIATVFAGERTVMTPNPDWRSAASIIGTARGPVVSRTPLLPLRYYTPRAHLVEVRGPEPVEEQVWRAVTARPECGGFFVLISDPWWDPVTPEERARIDEFSRTVRSDHARSLLVEQRQLQASGAGNRSR